tara:strand:- start:20638 stop:20988 length:351 start_codon:yes stop_codon:yes gene_type:complete
MDTKQIQYLVGIIIFFPALAASAYCVWAIQCKSYKKVGWFTKIAPALLVISIYLQAVSYSALKKEGEEAQRKLHQEWCEKMGYDFSYELWDSLGESGREGHHSYEPSKLPKKQNKY